MTAVREDITIEQGADYDTPFLLTDDAGDPEDLSGAAFVMQIRAGYGFPTALLTLSTAEETIEVDADAGSVTPVIGYEATAALLPGDYLYDLKELTADGHYRRRRQGKATVSAQITTIPVPAPAPAPSPDEYGNSDGDVYGNSSGDTYGP